jgi:LysM repeat protein
MEQLSLPMDGQGAGERSEASPQAIVPFSAQLPDRPDPGDTGDGLIPGGGAPAPIPYSPDLDTAPVWIIPGSGQPVGPAFAPPARRTRRAQIVVTGLALVALASMLVLVSPLGAAAAQKLSTFSALASAIGIQPAPDYVLYRVQPGDTYESIAARFGVQVGGIFEMNHLSAGQEPQTGEVIRIPTSHSYGAGYAPPQLASTWGAGIGPTNVTGSCMFCASAGWTNGTGKPCAPEGLAAIVDPAKFDLLAPDPGSHWVRGFTSFHNGIDMTTGKFGSPILAAQAGVVIFAAWDPFGGGYSIKINHCGGLATSYSHLEQMLVSVGQSVQQGQTIGLQGSTGNSTGAHLHLMTWWNNQPFDPLCAYGTIDGVSWAVHYDGCPSPQEPPRS